MKSLNLFLVAGLFPFLCAYQALAVDIQSPPEAQMAAQYEQMKATDYGSALPSYFDGGCKQTLAVASAPIQIVHTFTNRTSESAWWSRWMPGGKLFHTLGATVPIKFVVNRGRELQPNLILYGMGRVSLGAPPIGGKFVPGFAFVLYEQGREPVGIHAISPTILQTETAFFLNDFTNKLPVPEGRVGTLIANGLSLVIRSPLHLSTQHLIERIAREGVNTDRYFDADQLILRPVSDEMRNDTRFLDNTRAFGPAQFLQSFRSFQGMDGLLFQVVAVTSHGEEVLGFIQMADPREMPFIASAYGDNHFHIPHVTRSGTP